MDNILNKKVASKKTLLKVLNIDTKEVNKKHKIVIKALDLNTQKELSLADAWIDYNNYPQIRGLWYDPSASEISPYSTIARVLDAYRVSSLQELVGQTIVAYPDQNQFLVIIACDEANLIKTGQTSKNWHLVKNVRA